MYEELEKKYVLIKRSSFTSFIGGVVAVLVAGGVISYQSAKKALESSTAQQTAREIVEMRDSAGVDLSVIRGARVEAEEHVQRLRVMPGWRIVRERWPQPIPHGQGGGYDLVCPDRLSALSGGLINARSEVNVVQMYPIGDIFRISIDNTSTAHDLQPEVWAICADVALEHE